ncbi:uncharacterized protein LOC113352088 [Papaver somniferum]|uniref:uncharacterized protein LOC113352088 n=1 Tax=Papaver somniferum TaxID=3469 RepID=UPI000E701326|nr:uncharacterized protein LOC113352088 [Papaver somniferum]
MSCFKIPTTLLYKLDSLQLDFWWGHKAGKGIKFVGWDSINKSKEMGRLGFRDLETFNTALICKLVWKIATEDEELWVIGLDHPPLPAEGLVNTVSFSYVFDIFIENTRSWNAHLIYYLFNEDCANKILAMNVPVTGSITVPTQVWKSLWKVKLPHKIKIFTWKSVTINVTTILAQHGSFRKWVLSWFSVSANLVFDSGITRDDINKTLMVTAWTIWKDICTKVFQNKDPNRDSSVGGINNLTVMNVHNSSINNFLLHVQRCKPPETGFFKINLDASFKHLNSQGGIGLIVRDFASTCFGVQGEYFDGGMKQGIEVEELESRAMLAAVTLADMKNFNKVIFESDSEVVIKSINEKTSYVHWMNQHFILDIKYLLGRLEDWKCISVKREANGVADKQAKKARTSKSHFIFQSALPHDIKEWIDKDNHVTSSSYQ